MLGDRLAEQKRWGDEIWTGLGETPISWLISGIKFKMTHFMSAV